MTEPDSGSSLLTREDIRRFRAGTHLRLHEVLGSHPGHGPGGTEGVRCAVWAPNARTGSVIGAGALLPEGMEVPPDSVVLGVPAKIVRPVDEELRQRARETWEHYVIQAQRHRGGTYPRH